MKIDLAEFMSEVGELYYTVDNNRTRLVQDSGGVNVFDFQSPRALGFNLIVRARV